MKLIDEWRRSWRWFSMQSMGFATVLLGTWAALPDDLRAALPDWLVPAIAVCVLMLGIVGRLVAQQPKGRT